MGHIQTMVSRAYAINYKIISIINTDQGIYFM